MAVNQRSEWRDGFLFLGNQLALDFLNTRPVQKGVALELLPDFAALLRWFQAAGVLSTGAAARLRKRDRSGQGLRVLHGLLRFRERLRRQVQAWESGGNVERSFLAELNRLLARYPARTRLVVEGSRLHVRPYFQAEAPEDLYGPLVHSAATLFAEVDQPRVRQCAECILHFHDTSKKGTRRWCSMRLCGNRQKVAAYAARRRGKRRAQRH